MLLQRIRTSLWLPKIIFWATVSVLIFDASLVYAYITIEPSVLIQEAAKIQDNLTYKVIVNGDN